MTITVFLFSVLASIVANILTSYLLRLIDNKNDHHGNGDH